MTINWCSVFRLCVMKLLEGRIRVGSASESGLIQHARHSYTYTLRVMLHLSETVLMTDQCHRLTRQYRELIAIQNLHNMPCMGTTCCAFLSYILLFRFSVWVIYDAWYLLNIIEAWRLWSVFELFFTYSINWCWGKFSRPLKVNLV